MNVRINWNKGQLESVVLHGKERLKKQGPLFAIGLQNASGETLVTDAYGGQYEDGQYRGFSHLESVTVTAVTEEDQVRWRIEVTPKAGWAVEWVDFPCVTLPDLKAQDPQEGGRVLYPYNEGVMVDNRRLREQSSLRSVEPCYPFHGSMPVFPNMLCSQMMAYLWDDCGLYLGAHDPHRATKCLDFLGDEGGVAMRMRLYGGGDFGQRYAMDWDIVWQKIDGAWQSAADVYRAWFESALPPRVEKSKTNRRLPAWYEDSPLVVAYPVRGRFDTDDMSPNRLYPYTNALEVLGDIKKRTNSRILALLMHWEGTAPWAPPYVWPPYGDVENFLQFQEALHRQGDLLGVYCSGFGYTLHSHLTNYDRQEEYLQREWSKGMCAGPDSQVAVSRICTAQRQGYDICPASPKGRELLEEAYRPLLESGIDYSQILDQNHGGGQYFCYSRLHGHPPVPGQWMTQTMQELLEQWSDLANPMLLGCESAAAEPFIGSLAMSDNRFELNYRIGLPVPLYAYCYHEYVRNFMGNQVSCPLDQQTDTLAYRMAYSFSIGDCMTVVLSPEGEILNFWGARPHQVKANKEQILTLIANLTRFYCLQAKPYLYAGRMVTPLPLQCDTVTYAILHSNVPCRLPSVLCSAWESPEGPVHILVNPQPCQQRVILGGETFFVPPLDGILVQAKPQ